MREPPEFKDLRDRAEYLRQAFPNKDKFKPLSSMTMPDGGMVVRFATGEEARRFASFVKAIVPVKARDLVLVEDTAVRLTLPAGVNLYRGPSKAVS